MSEVALFHEDNGRAFDMKGLRALAHATVRGSSLIRRCMVGDLAAARAKHRGFFSFVHGFQNAIDTQVNINTLPRDLLYEQFQKDRTRKVLVSTARRLKTLNASEFDGVFGVLEGAVKKMQKEELSHAGYWIRDAANIGISRKELQSSFVVPGVKRLLDSAYTKDFVEFFAHLAATEFIAEELGYALDVTESPLFNQLFKKKGEEKGRWTWGIVHTLPHPEEISHLLIDLDFARAFNGGRDLKHIERAIRNIIHMFGVAADDVEAHYCPSQRAMAAE